MATAIPSPTPITSIIMKKKTIGLSLSSMEPPTGDVEEGGGSGYRGRGAQ